MNSLNNPTNVESELDLSNASRGVWLVKVPKYLAKGWEKAAGNMEVAKLQISKTTGQLPKVQLTLSEAPIYLTEEGDTNIPKNHYLSVSNVTRQVLGVFAHTNLDTETPERLFMEGSIAQKLECKPIASKTYYKMKSESFKKAYMPQKEMKQLKGIVQTFKPVSDHPYNNSFLKKTQNRKSRDDKDFVLNMLFAAFEKHQYYNIKDLHSITGQPMKYLRELLQDICNYNTRRPHKGMWDLKPEYRHYKEHQPVEGQEDIDNIDTNIDRE